MTFDRKSSQQQVTINENRPMKETSASDSAWKRSVASVFVLTSAFLYFAAYDMPGSLEKIIEKNFNLTTQQFEYLYTFYGIPPIIICLFGGIMIDKVFGLYKGLICFVSVALIGQVVITFGGFLKVYWLLILGRFVLGAGTESLIIALNCVIVLWFSGKELTLVFGMFQSLIRLGTTFAFTIAVPLYKRIETSSAPHKYVFGLTLTPFLLILVLQFVTVTALSFFTYKNFRSQSNKNHGETVTFSQIVRLPVKYWIVIAMFCISSSTIYAFVSCSQELFTNKYKMTLDEANHYSTFFNFFTFASLPFIALVINQFGYDLTFNLVGTILGILGQIIIVATPWNPYLPLIIYSISITIINICSMPMISCVVEEKQIATAYGVLQSGLNAVSAIFQLIVGFLLGKFGPESAAFFFMCCLIFGLVCTIVLFVMNSREDGLLNAPKNRTKRTNQA